MRLKYMRIIAMIIVFCMSCAVLPQIVFAQPEYTCQLTKFGHSGSASGTGIFIGTAGTTEGNAERAPFISGVTGNDGGTVRTTRVGALEFSVDGSIDPGTIKNAVLNISIESVNQNLKSNWMLLAAYETNNPTLSYTVGNMDASLYPAIDDNYSYEAAFWTNEQCSASNLGWKTMDVTRAVVHALENNTAGSETVKVVLRVQVPAQGLNVYTEGANAPYITITTGEKAEGVVKFVDGNGNSILPDKTFSAPVGEYNYSEIIESTLEIDSTIYMYDETASTTSITVEPEGENKIILVYNRVENIETFSGNTLIERGATCWFADPRSVTFEHDDIYENGELILPASSKTIVGAIDTDGTVKAIQHDNLTGKIVNVVIDTGFEPDDHNNPTFLYLPDHRIMVLWSMHTQEEFWYYRVTQKPDDLTTLGEEKRVSVAGYGTYTYPSPFYMTDSPDSFFVCWRGVSWHPTIAKYSLPDENDDIVCEINPTQIVQSIGARPYVKYGSNGKDRIYFTFTTAHPDNNCPNWVYYGEMDINTLNLYDIENNLLCEGVNLPYGKTNKINTSSDYGSFTVDNPTDKRDWVWDVAKDADGIPVILFTRISDTKAQHDYYYAKWNPDTKVWDKTYIADGGGWFHQNTNGKEMCYSGGMCLNHSNPSVVYLSKPTVGLNGKVYEIWKLEMDGVEIKSEVQVTTNSKYNNVRPFVSWGSSEDTPISLTWMNGLYYYWIANSSYPNAFPTSIMTTGIVPEFDYSQSMNMLSIPEVITSDFVFPKVTDDGLPVTWTSSDESVIDSNGYVTLSDSDKAVILAASSEYGEKSFNVTVPARNVMENNIVLNYEFENDDVYTLGTTTYVKDKSGNEKDAVVYGSAKVNGVLDLTANTTVMATNGYAVAPSGSLAGVKSYTFALRVNASNLNTQPRFYDFGKNSGNSVFLRGNQLSAGIKYNSGTTTLLSPSASLTPGTEYFLTVTFDAKTKVTKIYIDGKLATQGTNLVAEPYLFGQDARNYIGRTQWWDSSSSADNADYCGTIDDFYLFNAALTDDEIAKIYSGEFDTDKETEFGAELTVSETEIIVDINRGNISENAAIIVAAYTSDGYMIKADIAEDNSCVLPKENAATVKVFCFESLMDIKPVCEPIIKNLNN